MNIKINKYKNLDKLDLEIQDDKVNYIFGISGSGKSSIGEALKAENIEQNVLIGSKSEDVEILINGNKVEESLTVFNSSSVDKLLLNCTNNNMIYDIVFDNNNKMISLQQEFQSEISGLLSFKSEIFDYISKLDRMIKTFGGKITKSGTLPTNSKIEKIANAVKTTSDSETINIIKEKGNWYIPWIKTGVDSQDYKKDVCPFCKQPIKNEIKEKIKKILDFNEKDFEAMFQDDTILTDLGINIPNYSNVDEINALREDIIRNTLFKEELLNLVEYMDYYNNPSFDPSLLKEIEISKSFEIVFPNLNEKLISVNASIDKIKSTLGNLKQETDKIIAHNVGKINAYLDKFGINYIFDIIDYSNESNAISYSLFHKMDDEKSNRIYGLSFGEKNLISLLLFLLSSREKIIIIDDPASSFDDYRRKEILSLIYDACSNKTVLVLSHDHIFIKYAIFNYNNSKKMIDDGRDVSTIINKYFNNTGKILSMENYSIGNIKFKDISYTDFNSLANHILNFLNNDMEYFRLIINLRLYYETIKNNDNNEIYDYLSAIYHKIKKDDIIKLLGKRDINENDLINRIYSETGIKLSGVPLNEYQQIDINSLTMFEKILYYRDDEKDEIKDSFNNVVHMNESLHVCLNPYKYNYFSPYIYNIIISKNN